MVGVAQLPIQVHGSHTGPHHQKLALTQTGCHFLADPVHLVLPLARVRQGHRVIEDTKVGAVSVDLTAHADSFDAGVLGTVLGLPTEVDLGG